MLDLALPIIALLLGDQRRRASGASSTPSSTPRRRRRPQTSSRPRPGRRPPTVQPAPRPVTPAPVSNVPAPDVPPPAWPSAVPADLPPFPAGWRPHPRPGAVAGRASVLLPQLWARGAGAHVIEQTAGEWVAYRAEMMGSKKGVVAYVPKEPRAPAPRPTATAPARPPAPPRQLPPQASPPPPAETVLTSTSPGVVPSLFPASEAAITRPVLVLGSKGPDVVWVQNKLGIAPATGNYGTMTQGAVKKFQAAHGLKADGIVGPATWAAMGR